MASFRLAGRRGAGPLGGLAFLIAAGLAGLSDSLDSLEHARPAPQATHEAATEGWSYDPRTGVHGHVATASSKDPSPLTPWVAGGAVGFGVLALGLFGTVLFMPREEPEEEPKAPPTVAPVSEGIVLGRDGLDAELRALVAEQERAG